VALAETSLEDFPVDAPSWAAAARVLRIRRRAKPAQMALSRVATPPTPSAKRAP